MSKLNVLFLIIIYFLKCATGEFIFTDEMALKCKEYFCNNGYDYVDFFRVRPTHKSAGVKLEMHFAVKGIRDSHVLMSTTAQPTMTDSVYEIVIGAGGNTYSELRRMKKKFGKISTNTMNILSPSKYTAFWIKILDDGLLKFGKEGDELALITYKDPSPLEINYFSFASWSGVEIKILYDCLMSGNETDILESVPTSKNITDPSKILKMNLLENYDPSIIVGSLNNVLIHYDVTSLSFDVMTSKLTTHGHLTLVWNDPRLGWNSSESGISRLFFRNNELWEPQLFLYNSTSFDDLDPGKTKSKILSATFTGVVSRVHSLHITTWCNPSESLIHWPRDTHECNVDIGTWLKTSQYGVFKFSVVEGTNLSAMSKINMFPTQAEQTITSEWDLLKVIKTTEWTNNFPNSKNLTAHVDYDYDSKANVMRTTFVMRRRYHTYSLLYYSPFVAIAVMVLLTYCMPVSPTVKMLILGLNLIFVAACLSEILFKMPVFMVRIPNIVKFYLATLISISISIVLNVVFIKLTTEPKPWPSLNYRLKGFLDSPMANIFGVVMEKMDDTYNIISADGAKDSILTPVVEGDDKYWNLLIVAVERMMLFLLVCTFTAYFLTQY